MAFGPEMSNTCLKLFKTSSEAHVDLGASIKSNVELPGYPPQSKLSVQLKEPVC